MSNSTMHLGSLLRHLQHLSSLLQRCCHGCCVLAHRGVTGQRGFCRDWAASDDARVTWIGSRRMQAAEASQRKDRFDRFYPNKKRHLIGLRSTAWDGIVGVKSRWTSERSREPNQIIDRNGQKYGQELYPIKLYTAISHATSWLNFHRSQ